MRLISIVECGIMAALALVSPFSASLAAPPASFDDGAALCTRPAPGSAVPEPHELRSSDGHLEVALTVDNFREPDGSLRYCYHSSDGSVSPTLRVKPGDLLVLKLTNQLVDSDEAVAQHHGHRSTEMTADPCQSGVMSSVSTNLHFHGLAVPALCHQDEVLMTSIAPGSKPFEYRIRIPANQAAGLYWYHPHMHGFSAQQVSGGASGALIVEGLERSIPEVANLPERVIIIRDHSLWHADAAPAPVNIAQTPFVDHDGDATNTGTGFGRPARDLSVNFVPVPYPEYPSATIAMRPGERQLWRVLNASSVTYLNLAMMWTRGTWRRAQFMGLVAVDGVPVNAKGSPEPSFQWRDVILVPPGGRAEIMVNAPLEGTAAQLVTRFVDTGPAGENDPNRPLISIVTGPHAREPSTVVPAAAHRDATRTTWIGDVPPTHTRKLIFSEQAVDPNDPAGATEFYITVDGEQPKVYDPSARTPNIVVRQGDVEDWIIENRSSELHAFHIHQIHFEIVEWLGVAVNEPFLRDTINLPYWTPHMARYPAIKLRMDFRDPTTVGTFPYHCHLLDHEDNGMMGTVRIEPQASMR